MGNQIAVDAATDANGPYFDVSFFQGLSIRWLNVFTGRLRLEHDSDFNLSHNTDELRWNQYFRIFNEIREKRVVDNETQKRLQWHPATIGFQMENKATEDQIEDQEDGTGSLGDQSTIPDDHTEDARSEVGAEEDEQGVIQILSEGVRPHSDTVSTAIAEQSQRRRCKGWNSSLISPIYFGYTSQTACDFEKRVREEKESLHAREARAIAKAKTSRNTVIDSFEKTMLAQERLRVKKIEGLENSYRNATIKREREFKRSEEELAEIAFNAFKHEWETDKNAADAAFEEEIGELRQIHDDKTKADKEFLVKKREEVEAFKDAESQEIPAAERLEEFSRIEVSRCIDELQQTTTFMEEKRREYIDIKADFDAIVLENEAAGQANVQMLKQQQELKSMVNVAETAMKEAQRSSQEALESLLDAEILLDRAVRIKHQQDQLLPLFTAIAASHSLPSKCGLNAFIICAAILMKGSFAQKFNFLFRLFDPSFEGLFSFSFLQQMLKEVQNALVLLRFVPFPLPRNNLVDALQREFLSSNLNPDKDYLTMHETEHVFARLVSHSSVLCRTLGVSVSSEPSAIERSAFLQQDGTDRQMSSYQRSVMTPLALLHRGMINSTICKYRLYFEALRHRPQLEDNRKQTVHELALSLGRDDPLKADYNKYIVKQKKQNKYRVDPLQHGHLGNFVYMESALKHQAAIKIQSLVRSFHDRRLALLAAKHLAFSEAKQAAVKEMKAKVIREFKKRESGKGMGKMKWDAQVRVRQAKIRSTGQSVSRSDTVMMMIEEAIANALQEIEAKFLEMEKKENLHGLNFEKFRVISEPSKTKIDLTSSFGILPMEFVSAEALVSNQKDEMLEMEPGSLSRNQQEDDSVEGSSVIGSVQNDENSMVRKARIDRAFVQPIINHGNIRRIVEGHCRGLDACDPFAHGETSMEHELRLCLAAAEPENSIFLFNRLRIMHFRFTAFKVGELLAELPTKRLLVKYISSHSDEELTNEMVGHFKFKSDIFELLQLLRQIVSSDFEGGVAATFLKRLCDYSEEGLRRYAIKRIQPFLEDYGPIVRLRAESHSEHATEDLLADELERVKRQLIKFDKLCRENLQNALLLREKFFRFRLAFCEAQQKEHALFLAAGRMPACDAPASHNGILANPSLLLSTPLRVSPEIRCDWMPRLRTALECSSKPSVSFDLDCDGGKGADVDVELDSHTRRFEDICGVCREFLETAVADSIIIVNEVYQPRFRKTIPVVEERCVDGRAAECGRGIEDGKYYIHEAHNIIYKVCLDYDGVFNGSDEFAAKAAGNDVLAALEYGNLQVSRLNVPLAATIDHLGFRVLAVSKLPVQNVQFNDEGEVRRVSEELVHGVTKNGENFLNNSRTAQNILRSAAGRLNLCAHLCRGLLDISASSTHCSADVKVYIKSVNSIDEIFISNLWGAFPPEVPERTPHLHTAPRLQSIFWRRLRPEYVRRYSQALSPDACGSIAFKTIDNDTHFAAAARAADDLCKTKIPDFAEKLLKRNYTEPLARGLGIVFATELHVAGINIRHLGLMRSLFWRKLPGTVSMYHHEDFIRPSVDLRREVQPGERIVVDGVEYQIAADPSRPISQTSLPISVRYLGDSTNGLLASAGTLSSSHNSECIRKVILGEMVARAAKALIRFQMRLHNQQAQCGSSQLFRSLVCEYFNVITGSSKVADYVFREHLYEGVRERFGLLAVRPSERCNMMVDIQDVVPYVIDRLCSMLGVQLFVTTACEFHEHPLFFSFTSVDILEVMPVIKHSLAIFPYAEAMSAALQAAAVEKEMYSNVVLSDRPSLFYTFSERVGSRFGVNRAGASLGVEWIGTYSKGCQLQQKGPVCSDKYIRAVRFRPNAQSFVDTKYHASIVPTSAQQHFSLEIFLKCDGGRDTVRVVCMSGRYCLSIARDSMLMLTYFESNHDIVLRIAPVVEHQWMHVIVTYDATTLRCYIDSLLILATEIEPILRMKNSEFAHKVEKRRQDLIIEEQSEKMAVKSRTEADAVGFFQTKDGTAAMRKSARSIMETEEFQNENIGADARDQATMIKMRKIESLKRAKESYVEQSYQQALRELAERYASFQLELTDRVRKEIDEGQLRAYDSLRIGAANPNARTRVASQHFYGDISCLSLFTTCLSPDRVRKHYLCSSIDRRKDAQRMYSIACAKFEHAQFMSPDNLDVLDGHAKALCSFLRMEDSDRPAFARNEGKMRILQLIKTYRLRSNCEGIAKIIQVIPRDADFADLIAEAFLSIKSVDKNFFSGSNSLTRSDIVFMPFEYALVAPERPPEFLAAAAFIFQEVVRDLSLIYVYGETDLRWLPELRSATLVISLVKNAQEDKNLKIVRIAEMYRAAGFGGTSPVLDEDMLVLSRHLPMSEGFDVSQCFKLTDQALEYVNRMNNIKVLNLDECPLLTDKAILVICSLYKQLEVLSLAGVTLLTDDGLRPAAKSCKNLLVLNVNRCHKVTIEVLSNFADNNRRLNTLHFSGTQVTDDDLSILASKVNGDTLTSCDLSFCRDISDFGITSFVDACTKLRHLNMSGLSRVSDKGVRSVCSKCWHLQYLNLEDIFLLRDQAFWFNASFDGRLAANEHMLLSLRTLKLTDCVNLGDHGIEGLAERCRNIENLILQGCDKLTDQALAYMSDPSMSTSSSNPMCDSFKILSLANTAGLSSAAINRMLSFCVNLETLDLTGLASVVSDTFVQQMCVTCPTLQRVNFQKCTMISDAALCSMADFLWLESLDISFCSKVSDFGIEILSEACSGLREFVAHRSQGLTDKSAYALARNCVSLRKLTLTDCRHISEGAKVFIRNTVQGVASL